jgi:hypothetical protein
MHVSKQSDTCTGDQIYTLYIFSGSDFVRELKSTRRVERHVACKKMMKFTESDDY